MGEVTKKDLLLDSAMRIVAEKGLPSFSVQMVTKLAGTSEGLIYRHYQTKENLLLQCYLRIYGEIRDCIETDEMPEINTEKELYQYLHDLWMTYFDYLLRNGYKTLYFYEYRNSSYIKAAFENGDIDTRNFFQKTIANFTLLDEKFHILNKTDLKSFFIYVTDITVVCTIRILREEKDCDREKRESLWRLLWGGESWLVNK